MKTYNEILPAEWEKSLNISSVCDSVKRAMETYRYLPKQGRVVVPAGRRARFFRRRANFDGLIRVGREDPLCRKYHG